MVCCNMFLMSIVQPLVSWCFRYFTILEPWKGASPWDMRPSIFQSPYEPEKPLQSELSQAQLLWRSTITWWRSLAENLFEALGAGISSPKKTYTIIPSKIAVGNISALFSTNPSTSTKNIAYQKISRGMRSRFKTTQLMPSVMFESWLPLRRKTARPRSIYAPILRDLAFAGFRVTNHHRQIYIGWCIYGLFPKTGIGMYVNVHCILCYFEDHPISQSGSSSTPSHSFGMLHANGTQDP